MVDLKQLTKESSELIMSAQDKNRLSQIRAGLFGEDGILVSAYESVQGTLDGKRRLKKLHELNEVVFGILGRVDSAEIFLSGGSTGDMFKSAFVKAKELDCEKFWNEYPHLNPINYIEV